MKIGFLMWKKRKNVLFVRVVVKLSYWIHNALFVTVLGNTQKFQKTISNLTYVNVFS